MSFVILHTFTAMLPQYKPPSLTSRRCSPLHEGHGLPMPNAPHFQPANLYPPRAITITVKPNAHEPKRIPHFSKEMLLVHGIPAFGKACNILLRYTAIQQGHLLPLPACFSPARLLTLKPPLADSETEVAKSDPREHRFIRRHPRIS